MGFDVRRLREVVDDFFWERMWSALASIPGIALVLWRCNKGQTNPVSLDPGNPAFIDRRVARHHQAKLRWDEGGIVDVDGGTLGRYVSHHAAHDRTARRYVGRFVYFGSLVFSLFFHPRVGLDHHLWGEASGKP
jgi:hypothetical protein